MILYTFARIDQNQIQHKNKHAFVVKPWITSDNPNVSQHRSNKSNTTKAVQCHSKNKKKMLKPTAGQNRADNNPATKHKRIKSSH